MNPFTTLHVFLYRLTGGSIGGRFRGAPVLLLTTTGRKTGKQRTTPLLYLADETNLAIVASNGGRDRAPSWWSNLKRNPSVEVQIKRLKRKMTAVQATKEEKGRLWPLLTNMYPPYDDYQRRTQREIPIVLLRPSSAAAS
ncbi:MAG: nitroreductase family deazaflavin-dependent oxidoreductase [Thaumarchaeota archaeon]|nr:MAG: nitroreductase family deazaflavin-dependent oxidoreductase [Nitrososphaerota archaeon]